MSTDACKVVVLISGNGSNLQALIDASAKSNFTVSAVISNKAEALGLQRAQAAAITSHVVDHTSYSSREAFDTAVQEIVDQYRPGLVILAGFMRILSAGFVNHFSGRLINIHPSLLPKYTGMNTHQRALDANDTEHGASVHFVTEELDGGPVIAREVIAIKSDDDADSLRRRVAEAEHRLYPAVVQAIASGRVAMANGQANLDGKPLPQSGLGLESLPQ
ncbi:MAG: phosphoribosylglycinamide formyltransferase-1 [Pseudohongiellaceae bacterium]|jgi:phosphoribosylglycinamide formyltransferase-1